ncbi:two-component regulator propeller domain-containing protein [Gelidibacter maritimus]|uniref:histidine kinase n=1 Tax=Gelidibacter maritimus TaxID=2761487 RepID=A0A7W2M8T7_9FLAO|nr:two-component regulator propeller domain-containing protein [Gelidibacter maritimus]MBA6154789.1 response regulator [Gelidibacter maritimus]
MYSLKTHPFTFILILAFVISAGAQHHVNFTHLAPSSENRAIAVNKIIQDTFGNIWMVQREGIYIYDGYSYSHINNDIIFPTAQRYESIKDILRDDSGNIWLLSTEGSLTKHNPGSGDFKDLTPLIDQKKISVINSKNNETWLATTKGSLFKYSNSKMDSITSFPELANPLRDIVDIALVPNQNVFLSTSDGNVISYSISTQEKEFLAAPFNNYPESLRLLTDNYNRLWIGTETKGLFLYDINTKTFIQDSFFKGNTHHITNEMFLNLYIDTSGYLWAGTDGGGLYKVNLSSGEVSLFTKQANNGSSLSSNTILDIYEDNHKNLWITPNYGNLNILPNADNNINYHEGSENFTPTRILSIHKSSDGVLWAGTDGSGLTKITFNDGGSTNEKQFFTVSDTSKGFYIQSIEEDNRGNMWIGTYKNGLWLYDSKNNEFSKIQVLNAKNQKASDVRNIFKDSKGRIWVGSNIGLNIYSDSLELLASFENHENGLKGVIVESMLETRNGELWLGLYEGGLFQFNENYNQLNASTFLDFSILNDQLDRLKSVRSMSEGTFNSLWIINNSGELLKYDTKKNIYSSFKDIKTLSSRSLAAVINTENDNLWISSNNGIVNFNTRDSIIKTYYITDGLQDNVFLSRSAFKDHKNMVYFGGSKGFNYFYPKDLNKKESQPKLQINMIEVLNQPAEVLLQEQIDTGIANLSSLRLKYNQSSFSFRFAALDNILYPKHFYAYRLKGFDDDWIYNHQDRSATYTNIPAGNYTFEVKAGTRDDLWDIPPKSINIAIEQPFWNKPIAWVLYGCLFVLGIFGVRRWYALKKKLFLEKISFQKQNELHELKMNFFAKMSHEIQTPLTLILGPIQDMIHNAEKNGNLLLKQRLNIIAYNTKRLSKIAYELTLVRNKELDQLRLMVTKSNLYKNIEQIAQSFKELARQKNIDFTINCPKNLTEAWYDKEKLEHIIYNLLSNAFKFTPKEGNILLTVTPINSKKMVRLSVTDSGPGVSKDELNTIFELFYQSKFGKKNKGTGIGLALTKELIDLHKGKIEVDSSAISGTTFTITFPIHEAAYSDEERIMSDSEEDSTQLIAESDASPAESDHLNVLKKTILIVEDTLDLQLFLKELLQDQYNIILAENGNEGYHYAKSNIPDLIISDIMMPELDGIEMCKKLQDESLTQHIPIVLLTAKNSTHSKIEGLKSGAIEYINKPFNTNELLLKIQNILLAKEHIITKYRKEAISNPEVPFEKSQDEIFLENLVANINLRLEDASFKMEELAAPLNMSYSTIYRKCQALTGHTLVDFVRILRLKKAAVLITKNGFTISETAFMTGFNDPKYFSKCFKKQFKKSPLNFKNEAEKIGIDEYLNKHEVGIFV